MKTPSRLGMIIVAVILMAALVFILGRSLDQGAVDAVTEEESAVLQAATEPGQSPIRSEAGVFRGIDQASRFVGTDVQSKRYLSDYYERRAYPGAPPQIPHQVQSTMESGFNDCLGCHQNGGYASQFQAYAPVTPHPEMTNCRQCHVPLNSDQLFVESNWQRVEPPSLGRAALPGGPPPMPHGLQMRENCSACHSGPAAPKEIRTSHPERLYCRQCHVPSTINDTFTR